MDASPDINAAGTRVMPRIDATSPPPVPPATEIPAAVADATASRSQRPASKPRTVVSSPPRKSSVSTWALALFLILAAVAAALVFLR
jgi:hypothetical protein